MNSFGKSRVQIIRAFFTHSLDTGQVLAQTQTQAAALQAPQGIENCYNELVGGA